MTDPTESVPSPRKHLKRRLLIVFLVLLLAGVIGIPVAYLVSSQPTINERRVASAVRASYPDFCPLNEIIVSEKDWARTLLNSGLMLDPRRYWGVYCNARNSRTVAAIIDIKECTVRSPSSYSLLFSPDAYQRFYEFDESKMSVCPVLES